MLNICLKSKKKTNFTGRINAFRVIEHLKRINKVLTVSGDECSIFRVFVTKLWIGGSEYEYERCYSSFSNPKNLIEQHPNSYFSINATSSYNSFRIKENPIKGYYSFLHNSGYSSEETNTTTAYWMIDLKEKIILEKITVVIMVFTNYFRDVIVRFGDNSDFSMNTKIPYSGTPQAKSILVIKPITEISGQYISFETKSSYLAFGPISVFKKD